MGTEALQIPAPRQGWPTEAVDAVEELLVRVAELRRENEQLQTALESRVLIEQAKGVLAERHSLVPDQAFEAMRRSARSSNRRLDEVAAEIVTSGSTPPRVVREIQRPRGTM